MALPTKLRLRSEKYASNISKRGKVVPTVTENSKFSLGPVLLGFLIFVVVGSSLNHLHHSLLLWSCRTNVATRVSNISCKGRMNYAILQNRRPEKLPTDSFCDQRLKEIAKISGLSSEDFNGSAESIWTKLEELAKSDPETYQRFIRDQLQNEELISAESNGLQSYKFLDPSPGFVLKCMVHGTGSTGNLTKLFINICSHEAIQAPLYPKSNQTVTDDTRDLRTTSNLQIPLVIATLRRFRDASGKNCKVIDCVVHPWVIRRCEWDNSFKKDVLKLAVDWVKRDASLSIVMESAKYIKSRYKGGVTIGKKIITAKLRLDNDGKVVVNTDLDGTGEDAKAMQSPKDLLRQLQEDEAGAADLKELAIPSSGNAVGHKKNMIQVIGDDLEATEEDMSLSPIEKVGERTNTSSSKKPVVKRGFLCESKDFTLYPSGSNEGRKPSAFVNLMSKSQVIDMSTINTSSRDELRHTMSDDRVEHDSHVEDCHIDLEFDKLCQEADPEFNSIDENPVSSTFAAQLADFTRLISADRYN